jgi:sigma-B regulation protein RsbU (phosphoserine phosphatase)
MFVTVFYGVIDLGTGELTYANTGHNPPIIFRTQINRLRTLMPTGMAIGIEQDIKVADKVVKIFPGDVIILYTDGVTESFSPKEVMYGIERLKKVVKKANSTSAKSLLDDIESSITNFLNGMSPSDDITLIALLYKNN